MKQRIAPDRIPDPIGERPRVPMPVGPAPSRAQRVRSLAAIGLEIVLAVGSCLLFSAVFFAALGAIFPQGAALRDLVGRADNSDAEPRAADRTAQDSTAAVLNVVNRDVLYKRADGIVWKGATNGIVLGGGDGVQTSSRGEAEVAFDSENQLKLGRNTLIVIKHPSQDGGSGRRQSAVTVVSGELWAQLSPSPGRQMDLHIEAGGARARVRSGAANAGEAGFKVTIAPDRAPTFATFGGTADIEAQGKMVRISGNQFTTLDSTGPGAPSNILQPPPLVAPEDGAVLSNSHSGATFSWLAIEGAAHYRIVVARDPGFQKQVFDRRTERTRITSGPLAPGEYWWRVTGIRGDVEGVPSAPWQFSAQRSSAGPALRVGHPPAIVRSSKYRLAGTTEPGATVLAGGKRVVVDARGRFSCEVTLKRGVNVLVVEAIDAQGRSSYASNVINAKF